MEDSGHIPLWGGPRVLRTNVRGRHSYCEPFKSWIVEEAERPGMSMARLAMRNQVNANQLRRWVKSRRQDAGGEAAPAKLLPVTIGSHSVVMPGTTPRAGTAVEIELGCAVVHVRDGVTATTLRMVLQAPRGMTP